MKNYHSILLVLAVAALSSCTTYQYTARQTNVNRRSIDTPEKMAGVDIDYSKQVTATSEYQLTRNDAIAEAEFLCIQKSKIDVVIDPIVKIEYNPFKVKKRYRATIIGYAGKYKEEPTKLDKSKEYTLEEIEKYKLLNDPTFPQYYYNCSAGDNYFIGSGSSSNQELKPSLMFNQSNVKLGKAPKVYDYHKAIQLRNAGIATLCSGVVMMVGIGVGCYVGGSSSSSSSSSYYGYYGGSSSYNGGATSAGVAFMVLGSAAIAGSIPMIAIGSVRAKKAHKMDITLNAGNNGLGLGLTF